MRKLLIGAVAALAAGPALAQSDFPEPPMGGQMSGPTIGAMRPPERETLSDMKARLAQMFERLDADQDGVVEASEAARAPGGRMIQRTDLNADGRITKAEVEAAAEAMFQTLDKNGDGVVTADERPQRRQRPG